MKHIYVSSNEKNGGIFLFDQTKTGELAEREKITLSFPLCTLYDSHSLWTVCDRCFGNRSGLIRIALNRNGSMKPSSLPQDTLGEEGCHLGLWQNRIWVANYTDGSFFSSRGERKLHWGKGKDPVRQEGPHPHWVGPTPDGKYLAVVDLGLDRIFVYRADLSLRSCLSFPAGTGPRHLAFDPEGKYAFVSCELNSHLEMLSFEDGEFSRLFSVSSVPPSFCGRNYPAAVRLRGGRVYLSNRGHDSIASWRYDEAGLTDFQWASCGGAWPRDMQWAGDDLIVANEKSNSVTVMRAGEDGSLRLLPQTYSVPRALCVTVADGEN